MTKERFIATVAPNCDREVVALERTGEWVSGIVFFAFNWLRVRSRTPWLPESWKEDGIKRIGKGARSFHLECTDPASLTNLNNLR